jgi:hypothetical protein
MTQPAQHDAERPACIGVDVGGTFTDVVLSDGSQVWRAKSPSTPGSLAEGVIAACRLVAQRSGTTLEQLLPRVNWFGLGTTAVTNTIASRVGLRVGLITSAGFEDLVRSRAASGWQATAGWCPRWRLLTGSASSACLSTAIAPARSWWSLTSPRLQPRRPLSSGL